MIALTPPRYFAVAEWDGSAWPPRPSAQVVRWVGAPMNTAAPSDFDSSLDQYAVETSAVLPATGLIEHYIGDNATGTDGGALTGWPSEISGSVTVTDAPTVRDTGGPNGHRMVDFDATAENRLTTPSFQGSDRNTMTFACVLKLDSNANCNIVANDVSGLSNDLLFGVNANDDIGGFTWEDEMSIVAHPASGVVGMGTGFHVDTGVWHVWMFRLDFPNDVWQIWRDGKQMASGTQASASTVTNRAWTIGANPIITSGSTTSRYLDGQLAELAWWSRYLTDDEMVYVSTLLADTYGITS